MGNPLISTDLDMKISEILNSKLAASEMSLRRLAMESGVKLTRLGDVLRRGKAATVGELDAIAGALGLVGWKIMREAELVLDPTLTYPTYTLAADNQWRDPELEAYGAQESP